MHASGIGAALIGGPVIDRADRRSGSARSPRWSLPWRGSMSPPASRCASFSAAYNLLQRPAWVDRLRRLRQVGDLFQRSRAPTHPSPVLALGARRLSCGDLVGRGRGGAGADDPCSPRGLAGCRFRFTWGLAGQARSGAGRWCRGSQPDRVLAARCGGDHLFLRHAPFLLWNRLPFHNTIVARLRSSIGVARLLRRIAAELWLRVNPV